MMFWRLSGESIKFDDRSGPEYLALEEKSRDL
jgi:hypothetical protein